MRGLTAVDIAGAASIGVQCFYGNTLLTGVTLPETLETIGANAFSQCPALTELTLPRSLTEISAAAFTDSSIRFTVFPDSYGMDYCVKNELDYKTANE